VQTTDEARQGQACARQESLSIRAAHSGSRQPAQYERGFPKDVRFRCRRAICRRDRFSSIAAVYRGAYAGS
jgi:hypothetical protein